jgi:hypothetical protein
MKAVSLILQYYNSRLELVEIELDFNEVKEYIDTMKKAEKDIEIKEDALQAYLEGRS